VQDELGIHFDVVRLFFWAPSRVVAGEDAVRYLLWATSVAATRLGWPKSSQESSSIGSD